MNREYALTNPLSLLLDKAPKDFTRADLVRVLEERRLEKITFHYTALDGKYKELKIPIVSHLQAEQILTDGERVDGSSLFKGMVDPALSDLYVVPVYRTAFLNPFDPSSLDFTCRYLTRDGDLAPFGLDNVLHRASRLFRDRTGLELYALGELEFFLLSEAGHPIFHSVKQRGYHASAPFLKSGTILDEMVRAISQITGAVKYAHSEVGYVESVRSDIAEIRGRQAEQLEVEFLPTPVEETGDILVLSRWLIRNVAYTHGCVATFTPKLEEGIAGNGLHVHMDIRRDGENIMTSAQGGLSTEAKRLIGGLCQYADSLTAFGNTVSSAYLRLVPNQEAPTRVCWSDMNRSAMIRVPLGWSTVKDLANTLNPEQAPVAGPNGRRQTVEIRHPDGSALVHLLLAGITMAAEWGLTNAESETIARELYASGNIFQNDIMLGKLPSLPKSCVESSKILLKKRSLYERDGVFPPSIIAYVANMLEGENDEHMNRLLVDLPADDRLHETRKIMHKDLHKH